MLDRVLESMRQCLSLQPDVLCLPETFLTGNLSGPFPATAIAEDGSGRWLEPLAQVARDHRCNMICPMLTRRQNQLFNSALVLDRDGHLVGHHDKMRPSAAERAGGIQAGTAAGSAFDLDFGRIAIHFADDGQGPNAQHRLDMFGAELVFCPATASDGRRLRRLASRHQSYVVSSCSRGAAQVIDPHGKELTTSGGLGDWVLEPIRLEFEQPELATGRCGQ